MTRLGDIWKFVATKFLAKEAPYYLQRFGLFWKSSLLCNNCIGYFWGNFWKKLGHFLLQHLVTLAVANLERSTPLQQLTLESFDNICVCFLYFLFRCCLLFLLNEFIYLSEIRGSFNRCNFFGKSIRKKNIYIIKSESTNFGSDLKTYRFKFELKTGLSSFISNYLKS